MNSSCQGRTIALLVLIAVLGVPLASPGPARAKECDNATFGTASCGRHFDIRIAGVRLGDTQTTVHGLLGAPRSHRRGPILNCVFHGGGYPLVRPSVEHYADGLTVKFERLSHGTDLCWKSPRNPHATVSDIVTTSPRDLFPNGIHVGSRMRRAKRLFRKNGVACTGASLCSIPVHKPRFARRDNASGAFMMLHGRGGRITSIELLLHRFYS